MDSYGHVSEQLKRRRKQAGLSLSQLARRVDTSAATVSRYEHGWARFRVDTLRKLATALGCRLLITLEPVDAPRGKPTPEYMAQKLGRLFWDRRLCKSDFHDYPLWIVERVLEYGSLDDIRLLMNMMGRNTFLENVSRARLQSAKTITFWHRMLEKEDIPCTRRYSRHTVDNCWPH